MALLIEAIYENGVFRPLEPVELTENQRVSLSLNGLDTPPASPLNRYEVPEKLKPPLFPEEDSIIDDEPYLGVPLRSAGSILVNFIDGGRLLPGVFPEESDQE